MPESIKLDLDRERIRTILTEAYTTCQTVLNAEFDISKEAFADKINPYLDSNRVTIPVMLDLPSKKEPGVRIEVNIRSKKVFARLTFHRNKQAQINYFLKVL